MTPRRYYHTRAVYGRKGPLAGKWPMTAWDYGRIDLPPDGVSVKVVVRPAGNVDLSRTKGTIEWSSQSRTLGYAVLKCTHPRCGSGRFGVGEVVRKAIAARETRREFEELCHGDIGPKQRKRKTFYDPAFRRCTNAWCGTVEVVYAPEEKPVG